MDEFEAALEVARSEERRARQQALEQEANAQRERERFEDARTEHARLDDETRREIYKTAERAVPVLRDHHISGPTYFRLQPNWWPLKGYPQLLDRPIALPSSLEAWDLGTLFLGMKYNTYYERDEEDLLGLILVEDGRLLARYPGVPPLATAPFSSEGLSLGPASSGLLNRHRAEVDKYFLSEIARLSSGSDSRELVNWYRNRLTFRLSDSPLQPGVKAPGEYTIPAEPRISDMIIKRVGQLTA